jgi:hypothetical protein
MTESIKKNQTKTPKKAAVKKAPAKKTAPKKAVAKKAPVKKAAVKKAPVKKAAEKQPEVQFDILDELRDEVIEWADDFIAANPNVKVNGKVGILQTWFRKFFSRRAK